MAVETGRIIDGRAVAHRVKAEVAEQVRGLASASWRTPGLATVLLGDDPASAVHNAYERQMLRVARAVGPGLAHHDQHAAARVQRRGPGVRDGPGAARAGAHLPLHARDRDG